MSTTSVTTVTHSTGSSATRRVWAALASVPWWIWVIAGVALIPRLTMIGYGLPYELDPDEQLFVDSAWRIVEQRSPDPFRFGIPAATVIDLLALLYTAYGAVGAALGAFDGILGAGEAYRADVTHFFLLGRMVSILSGVAVVLMTYALARQLRIAVFWAAIAALMVALSPAMVQFSSIVRPDMPMTAFLLAVVWVMIRALDRPSGKDFVIAGALLALSTASKFPGALGVIPIVVANATLVVEGKITPRRGLIWLAGCAVAGLAVSFLVAPYLFLDLGSTIAGLRFENRSVHLGAMGSGLPGNLWRYLTEALPAALGLVGATLGVVGLAAMLVPRRSRIHSSAFWGLLVFLSSRSLWWLRWTLPLVPLAATGGVYVLDWLEGVVFRARPGGWVLATRTMVGGLLLLPLLSPTLTAVGATMANDDIRLRAIDWIHRNVPDGSTILIESYTAQVSSERYDVLIARARELLPWEQVSPKVRPDGYFGDIGQYWLGTPTDLLEAIVSKDVDYVVLSDLWIDLAQENAEVSAKSVAIYEALMDTYPVVAKFDRNDASLGWPVNILMVSSPGPEG